MYAMPNAGDVQKKMKAIMEFAFAAVVLYVVGNALSSSPAAAGVCYLFAGVSVAGVVLIAGT